VPTFLKLIMLAPLQHILQSMLITPLISANTDFLSNMFLALWTLCFAPYCTLQEYESKNCCLLIRRQEDEQNLEAMSSRESDCWLESKRQSFGQLDVKVQQIFAQVG
jgi:hypothetical protein